MLYNKNNFLRKLASKVMGSSDRQNEKCKNTANTELTENQHSCKNLDKCMKPSGDAISNSPTNQRFSENEKRDSEQSALATPGAGSTVSGLLAAKLKCDEWGLEPQSVKKSTTSQGVGFSNRFSNNLKQYNSPKTLRSKKLHPSNKSQAQTLQRSRSMKERRQALDNIRKYRSCSSSLFRIDEIDENNEKDIS